MGKTTTTTKNRTQPLPLAVWGETVNQITLDKHHRKFLCSSFPPTSFPPHYGLGKKTFLLNQQVDQCSSSGPTDTSAEMRQARGRKQHGSTQTYSFKTALWGLRCWDRIYFSNHSCTRGHLTAQSASTGTWLRSFSPSAQRFGSLCCSYIIPLGARNFSLIDLIFSPCSNRLSFPGRLAVFPANFPTEDYFNYSFAANNAIYLQVDIYFWILTIFLKTLPCSVMSVCK